jgi:hypothetical protein
MSNIPYLDIVLNLLCVKDRTAFHNLIDRSDIKKRERLRSIINDASLFESKHAKNSNKAYSCAAMVFALKMVENNNQDTNKFYDFSYYFEFTILKFKSRLDKMAFSQSSEEVDSIEEYIRTRLFGGPLFDFVSKKLNDRANDKLLSTFNKYRERWSNKLKYRENEAANLYGDSVDRPRSRRIRELATQRKIKFNNDPSAVVHYIKHSHECIKDQNLSPFRTIRTLPEQFQREANDPCTIFFNELTYKKTYDEGQFQESGPFYLAHTKKTVLSVSDPLCLVSYYKIRLGKGNSERRRPHYN